MKYKQVYEFKWLLVAFLLFLIYLSNLIFIELPFIRVFFRYEDINDGLTKYFLSIFPRFSFEMHAYNIQTLVVWSTGVILGSRLGLITLAIYLFLGLLGLPVFAGGGGIDYFKEPTFGYLLSLPLNAYLSGLFFENKKNYLAILVPMFCTHLIGIIYLIFFNPNLLDFTWHLSFSMVGYDLIFSFILIPILPIISFLLHEIIMQEVPVHESFSIEKKVPRFSREKI